MKDKTNQIYNIDFMDNDLPDGCANLIIADPPYFEIKGDFDFAWDSFEDYLKDVEKWAIECKRLLAENGTLFWYGDDKRIANAQIIFDKHFNLLNNLVWHKGENFMGLNKSEGLRSFAPCTERILMYSSLAQDPTRLETFKLDVNNFKVLRNYFKELHEWMDVSKRLLINEVGQSVDHCFRYNSTQWDLPTLKTYNELIEKFKINEWDSFREYERLRGQYEELRRPFDNFLNANEVLRFNNESAMHTQYSHPTRKPQKLTRALILTASRPNDLVLVPFAGSGTECAASLLESRRFIGYEIDQKYFDIANKRIDHARSSTIKMF
jgi:site-specific DNA-methyltransferase (adenine-specific)